MHGMLVFGQSKAVRRRVHEHYRPLCKRVKVEVELDTLQAFRGQWQLRRRSVWAHAWIWRNTADGVGAWFTDREKTRRYDDYLATGLGPARSLSLRIEPARWIEDDRETISLGDEDGEEIEGSKWEVLSDEPTQEWREGSDGGAAVAWDRDEQCGPGYDICDHDEEADWECDPSAGALGRDYGRNGNAGCW